MPDIFMDSLFIVTKDGSKEGPFTRQELKRRLVTGEVTYSTLVWSPGMSSWDHVGNLLFRSGATSSLNTASSSSPSALPPPLPNEQLTPPPFFVCPPNEQAAHLGVSETDLFYIFAPGKNQEGPYTKYQIQEGMNNGSYPEGTAIRKEGIEGWEPLHAYFSNNFRSISSMDYYSVAQSLTACLRRYTRLRGRASRSEFSWFFLCYVLVWICVCCLPDLAMAYHYYNMADCLFKITMFALVAALVPMLSVTVRRLHDIGLSGFLVIFPIILQPLLFLMMVPAADAPNIYGVGPDKPDD